MRRDLFIWHRSPRLVGQKNPFLDALSCIHSALAGIACMTLTSSCMLQCRGSKQGKQPAAAVTACIIRDDSSSSGLPSPEPTDDLQSGSIPTPTPAVTPPLPASANPVWDHCLSCQFAEGQVQTGQLQLALLNETDGTILARLAGRPSVLCLDNWGNLQKPILCTIVACLYKARQLLWLNLRAHPSILIHRVGHPPPPKSEDARAHSFLRANLPAALFHMQHWQEHVGCPQIVKADLRGRLCPT